MITLANPNLYNLLDSVCRRGDGQGMDRDIQTGLEGRGCTSYDLWSVQRSSVARHNVPVSHCLWKHKCVMCKADITLYSRSWTTAVRTLPSMPMSRRLDVSCPQFLLACCLLIQFQLKPRKSTTIFFPTVSFKVCCRYTLEIHEERNIQSAWAALFHNLRPTTSHNAAHFYYYICVCCRISSCLQGVSVSSDHVLFKPRRTTWLWGSWVM